MNNSNPVRKYIPKELIRSLYNTNEGIFDYGRNDTKYIIIPGDYPKISYLSTKIDITKSITREDFLIHRDHSIIQEPSPFYEILISIDSRDRDPVSFPDSNSYIVKLNKEYNVYSVELLNALIPNSQYMINDSNNTIVFYETNGILVTAVLSYGNYDITQLLLEIQNKMTSAGGSNYTASLTGSRVQISSDLTGGGNIFTLAFTDYTNNLYNILGFRFETIYSGNSNYIAPWIYNIHNRAEVLVTFDTFNKLEPFLVPLLPVTLLNHSTHIVRGQSKNVNSLHISIRNLDTSPYLSNGAEHSILIKMNCIVNT